MKNLEIEKDKTYLDGADQEICIVHVEDRVVIGIYYSN